MIGTWGETDIILGSEEYVPFTFYSLKNFLPYSEWI